jgi:hypothetical protein
LLVPGGVPIFPPPRFFLFPFRAEDGGNPASQVSATWEQKTNRPKWWKLADSTFRIHFSLPLGTKQTSEGKHFALVQGRSILRCMANDTPQDTTTTQDTPTDQPVAQPEPPKAEEQPTETPPTETPVETPKETEPTLTEEPKTETLPEVPETPQTPEPPKQDEQKPAEETKPEEKPKEETKQEEKVSSSPEPETTKPSEKPQINLDELRTKANKERQDRKQEHLSVVEKLAKSKQINNDDVRELLHVSQSTATNYLEELTKQGKLKKSGKAKGTTYSS